MLLLLIYFDNNLLKNERMDFVDFKKNIFYFENILLIGYLILCPWSVASDSLLSFQRVLCNTFPPFFLFSLTLGIDLYIKIPILNIRNGFNS